jgi:NADPH-dependent 2,4-dienoyl-CoA reductase/sulfur reductase-like enzyme
MPREQFVVIGGVAAGMSAASRARRRNSELDIIVLEKGQHVSYGACGLPYYVSGEVEDWNDLVVYTADYFREKRGIDVRLGHEAVEIEPGRKLVRALRPGSQPVGIPYDKLLIATGAAAGLKIPGAELPGVFTCGDLAGTIRLREFLDKKKPKTAVVAGSGYIGLELADALSHRGIEVVMLGRAEHVLEGFEVEIQAQVETTLAAHRVTLKKNCPATQITSSGVTGEMHVHLHVHHTGGSEEAGVVILATGIVPRTSLAESAGVLVGTTGGIAVDDRMQTNINGIYAAGDCCETRHLVSGRPVYFPLGTTANKMGRVAGENVAGGNARFEGIVGTLATKVFEIEVARTGLSASEARAAGFDPGSVSIRTISRAKYLGGRPLLATLLWDRPSGRLLGFQVAGEDGAAKRVDAAAVALHGRMRVADMLHLDLSYAPPFAGVWEALLIAAGESVKESRRY